MKTPTTKNLKEFKDKVYEPSEDTYLLLDALEEDIKTLETLNPLFSLEIGSGSGLPITFLQKLIPKTLCFSTDLNRFACEATRKTAIENGESIDAINTIFTNGIRTKFDLILFNPPYVVTTAKSETYSLENAWAGGINGREVIDEFIMLVDDITQQNAIVYLVCINENDPKELQSLMTAKGYESVDLKYRVCGWEGLHVLRFKRQSA